MDKCRLNIAVIEPSVLMFEGLSGVLLQNGCVHYNIYHFEHIDELNHAIPNLKINLIVVNPTQVKSNIKSFNAYRRTNSSIPWIALIYSFFERDIVDLFDAVIQVTDTPETIVSTIQNLITVRCQCKSAPKEQLTPRETDVLKHLVQGLSNKEIADQLSISIHTVISHRKSIIQKTGIKSQSGLTIYAISNNIINIEDYQP